MKPVETGKEYQLVTATAWTSHSRPIFFGVTFGDYKSYAQLTGEVMDKTGCDVLKDVELRFEVFVYLGFGQEVTGIRGKCLKLGRAK